MTDLEGLPYGTLAKLAMQMRRDSKHSVVATGKLPALNQALYVRDHIDETISEWLTGGAGSLLVLTGSAGHGKSASIAIAMAAASEAGIGIHVRADASQSDAPDETYREALERFLTHWLEHPDQKHILGMNLGKALDFFSDPAARSRYPSLAHTLNETYGLGLEVAGSREETVRILDLSTRIQPVKRGSRIDLPLVSELLARLDPEAPQSIIKEAWACQQDEGLGVSDPIVANVRLLSQPHFRQNLVEALASCIVRHDVHLTPRAVLDLVSRLILPPSLERSVDIDGHWTQDAAERLTPAEQWGSRLDASLLRELFPPEARLLEEENTLLRALRHENPTYCRTRDMDQRLLAWSHRPEALAEDIPRWFLEYLRWRPNKPLTPQARRILVQVAAWTRDDDSANPRVERVLEFLELLEGKPSDPQRVMQMLQRGLQQCVTKTYHRAFDTRSIGNRIAVQVHRTPTPIPVRTELDSFNIKLGDNARGVKRTFRLYVVRAGHNDIPLDIDWATFDLLCEVYSGIHPGTANRATSHAIDRLTRTLQGASHMNTSLECDMPESGLKLRLTRDRASSRPRLRAEVIHD